MNDELEELSAPAGWYEADDEPDVWRWWDGTEWTEHRAPMYPPPGPAREASSGVTDAISKAGNYVKAFVQDPENKATGQAVLGGALVADGIVGFGKNRQGLGGGLWTAGFGVVWFLVSMMLLSPLVSGPSKGPGEVEVAGHVVTNEWRESDSYREADAYCYPLVEFVSGGETYSVESTFGSVPCANAVGDEIKVIYTPGQEVRSAKLDSSQHPFAFIGFLFPAIGIGMIVLGALNFIKKLLQVGGGLVLLQNGLSRRKRIRAEKNADA